MGRDAGRSGSFACGPGSVLRGLQARRSRAIGPKDHVPNTLLFRGLAIYSRARATSGWKILTRAAFQLIAVGRLQSPSVGRFRAG